MKDVWIITLILGLWTVDSFGQAACDSLYTVVDEMPKYGEGIQDFLSDVRKDVKVAKPCRFEDLNWLTWTINKEGEMVNIDAFGLQGQCWIAVLEQLRGFPTWTPGRLNGKPVCVKMNLTIHIRPSD